MSRIFSRLIPGLPTALSGAALAAFLIVGSQQTMAAAEFVIKVAIFPTDEIHHEFGRKYEQRLEEVTGGRIDVQLFLGHQLGGVAEMVDGGQVGTIEISMLPPGFFKGVDPRYQVTDVPGLFDDIAHISRALSCPHFRDHFMRMTEDKGMIGVAVFDYGPTAYASLEPIRTLADFKGKKIRVLATDVERAVISEFGGTGIPMDMANVIPALQRGQLDGIRSTIVVLAALKFFDVTKYVTLVEDTHIPDMAMMSKKFFDSLPADLQKAVLDVGAELERYMEDVVIRYDRRAANLWRSKGGEVIRLSMADRDEFMKRTAPISDEIMGGDPELAPMYNRLKECARITRLTDHERKKGSGL